MGLIFRCLVIIYGKTSTKVISSLACFRFPEVRNYRRQQRVMEYCPLTWRTREYTLFWMVIAFLPENVQGLKNLLSLQASWKTVFQNSWWYFLFMKQVTNLIRSPIHVYKLHHCTNFWCLHLSYSEWKLKAS